jgi:hypothetical protein
MRIGPWRIGRPYLHRPFHPGMPTWRDWKLLLAGTLILAAGLSHYIAVGVNHGWQAGVRALATETLNELRSDWK